jgi:hypothetical protein
MRAPVRIALAATFLLLFRPAVAGAGAGDAGDSTGNARITYLVGGSVYLDAGREMGLVEGMTVEVVREGKAVAVLKVAYLSSRRASCTVRSSEVELAVGDRVRFAPEAVPVPEPEAADTSGPTASRSGRNGSWARDLGLRGRLGVRYLAVSDLSGVGEDFSQPSLDAMVTGHRVGGATST